MISDILIKIYEYDKTYKDEYSYVLNQLNNFISRYDIHKLKYFFFEEEFYEYILYNLRNKFSNSCVLTKYFKYNKNINYV